MTIQIGDQVIYHSNIAASVPQYGIVTAIDGDCMMTINGATGQVNYVHDKHIHAINGHLREGHTVHTVHKDHPVYTTFLKIP